MFINVPNYLFEKESYDHSFNVLLSSCQVYTLYFNLHKQLYSLNQFLLLHSLINTLIQSIYFLYSCRIKVNVRYFESLLLTKYLIRDIEKNIIECVHHHNILHL